MPRPTIWKPVKLWTGKQLITSLLKTLALTVGSESNGMSLTSKYKIKSSLWGLKNKEENIVTVLNNELLTGITDKSQFGAS